MTVPTDISRMDETYEERKRRQPREPRVHMADIVPFEDAFRDCEYYVYLPKSGMCAIFPTLAGST